MKKLVYSIITCFALVACQQSKERPPYSSESSEEMPVNKTVSEGESESPEASDQHNLSPVRDKKIIKTATLRYEVEDLQEHEKYLQKEVKKWGASISFSSLQNDAYRMSQEMTLRVAPENMEKLIDALLGQASYINEKNIQARDVGEEFVDLQARLKNKRAAEAQYREILKKAEKIEDILKVEDKIRGITEEIEARQGRLNYLMDQVGQSTVQVVYYQNVPEMAQGPGKTFFTKLGDGFKGGWQTLLSFFIGLSYVWPLLIVIAVLVFIFRRFRRRKKIIQVPPVKGKEK